MAQLHHLGAAQELRSDLPAHHARRLQGHLQGESGQALRLARQAARRQTVPDGRQVHGRGRLSVHDPALDHAHRDGFGQMAEPQGLCRPRRRAPEGAGGAQGGGIDQIAERQTTEERTFSSVVCPQSSVVYLSGGPIVTVSLPTPSISHSSLSPATVAATPDGVPVMMMSPAASSTISESFTITSGTFQIICARSPSWRILPLTLSAIRPLLGWPILLAGCSGPHGADASKALPISHGRFISREAICRSRRVRSMPTP